MKVIPKINADILYGIYSSLNPSQSQYFRYNNDFFGWADSAIYQFFLNIENEKILLNHYYQKLKKIENNP